MPTPRRTGLAPLLALTCLLLFLLSTAQAQQAQAPADPFPGRALFSTVTVMSLDDLAQKRADVHVVDVRSKYEYDTLHIADAVHIDLHDAEFVDKVKALQAQKDAPVVFYCNGKTCYKSYQACDKTLSAGVMNVYAYDAGIFDWAKAHPEASVLLGKSPVDPARLIDEARFKEHLLAPEKFGERVHAGGVVVLDVSDPLQRAATALFPGEQRSIALDDTADLDTLMAEVIKSGKPLLVYDEAGKQIQWFQYYLEDRGVKSYYFMKGGSKAFFKEVLMGG